MSLIFNKLRYSIWDPAGNITALVEDPFDISRQPSAATEIMKKHPEVEQVGFVRFASWDGPVQADLRMAGGEFCGNGSICAAALFFLKHSRGNENIPVEVKLRVSGASDPVIVNLSPGMENNVKAGILMPQVLQTEETDLSFGSIHERLPVVHMEGISHVIITPDSNFFRLIQDHEAAGRAVRYWCGELMSDCLGLMFLEKNGHDCSLKPLVYVPACNTTFWENSCASGSAAIGWYLSYAAQITQSVEIQEPGGRLRVEIFPETKSIWLYSIVYLLREEVLGV